ncbi:hypothetical protein TYRP_012923 [Tyrophagus putrescentiae]|nr:hypothetical protein TYRP_012923 [Tyrophagus putrescentiae]
MNDRFDSAWSARSSAASSSRWKRRTRDRFCELMPSCKQTHKQSLSAISCSRCSCLWSSSVCSSSSFTRWSFFRSIFSVSACRRRSSSTSISTSRMRLSSLAITRLPPASAFASTSSMRTCRLRTSVSSDFLMVSSFCTRSVSSISRSLVDFTSMVDVDGRQLVHSDHRLLVQLLGGSLRPLRLLQVDAHLLQLGGERLAAALGDAQLVDGLLQLTMHLIVVNVGLVGGIQRQLQLGNLRLVLLLQSSHLGLQLRLRLGQAHVQLLNLDLTQRWDSPQRLNLLLLLRQSLLVVVAHLGQLRRQSLVLRLLLLSQRLRLLVGGGQLLALILQSLDLNLLLVDAAVGVVQLRLGLGEVLLSFLFSRASASFWSRSFSYSCCSFCRSAIFTRRSFCVCSSRMLTSSSLLFRSRLIFSSWTTFFSRACAWAVAFSRSMISTSTSDCRRLFCFSRELHLFSSASSCSSYSEIFCAILRLKGLLNYRSSSTSSACACSSASYLDFQLAASPLALVSCRSSSRRASDSSSSCTFSDSSSTSSVWACTYALLVLQSVAGVLQLLRNLPLQVVGIVQRDLVLVHLLDQLGVLHAQALAVGGHLGHRAVHLLDLDVQLVDGVLQLLHGLLRDQLLLVGRLHLGEQLEDLRLELLLLLHSLVLGLLHLIQLILHLGDGRLVLLAQVVRRLLALHVHVLQQLAQLRQLRVALLVHLRLRKVRTTDSLEPSASSRRSVRFISCTVMSDFSRSTW